jgi:hypothetical protein
MRQKVLQRDWTNSTGYQVGLGSKEDEVQTSFVFN